MSSITDAFEAIDRSNFIPDEYKAEAKADAPLPIGYGQTISQPTTVRLMLTWLDVKPGNRVLDVGSGSGWTTALLSALSGKTGKVFAVELIPELVKQGKNNCERIGINNVEFLQAASEYGLPKQAPYDRILVSASAKQLPAELIDQLKIGGILVIPVKNDILEITKKSPHEYETTTHPGFIFVPLIKPAK